VRKRPAHEKWGGKLSSQGLKFTIRSLKGRIGWLEQRAPGGRGEGKIGLFLSGSGRVVFVS